MTKHIVFVCVENSCRSQLAEALGHMHKTADVEVYSAGSKPSGKVNPKAVAAMAALGYDLTRHHSKSLEDIPDVEYAAVITMGCGDECPWVRATLREDWGLPDPKFLAQDEFNQVRDVIEDKVKALLARLA